MLKSGLRPHITETVSSEQIDQLISDRELARSQKDYKKADEIRETLLESGIIIEDGPKGVFWRSIWMFKALQ